MKRSIEVEGTGVELELSKVTELHLDKEMIHFDKLKDGTWRMIYSSKTIPNITGIEGLKIIRKD